MASSRRDFFRSMLGRRGADSEPEDAIEESAEGIKEPPEKKEEGSGEVALILDRFCLAYQGTFCSVCVEQCPEAGAILTEMGKPRVEPDKCTGCKICQTVCPAPRNAIFTVARAPKTGMIGKWEENRVDLSGDASGESEED